MTDAERAAEELARVMARVSEELADLGKVSKQTQDDLTDAQMKAKYGIENYTKGTEKAAEGVMALGKAGFAAGKAMLDGKKGAAAFNSTLDELATAATAAGAALAIMVPGGILIKGLVAGLTMAATAAIKYTQAANELADQLHKGYVGLAKSGGAAADGMTGLKNDAQKLGLAMNELDVLVNTVAENSKDFALFAGSVAEGRKKFADLGQAMEPARGQFLNLGLEVKDQIEGMAGYVRMQTRLGNAQKMSVDQLTAGAKSYLKEQDALTKLTGQSRAEMEQQRERALQKEQFAAKIRELQLAGNTKGAEALLKLNSIYERAGPETAAGFQAIVTGNLASADAQKLNLASQGEVIRTNEMVVNGQMSYLEAAQRSGKAISKTADTVGTTLGQLGAYNDKFGNLAEQINFGQLVEGDIVANMERIKKDQERAMAGADPLVAQQTKLIETQISANKKMTDFIFKGIGTAQTSMEGLASVTDRVAEGLNRLLRMFGFGEKSAETTKAEKEQDTAKGKFDEVMQGATLMQKMGIGRTQEQKAAYDAYRKAEDTAAKMRAKDELSARAKEGDANAKEVLEGGLFNIPSASDGGFLTGPKSGYLAMLHGNELVIPEDQLLGKISSGGMAGAGSEQLDKMNDLYNEMLKDTQALEKLTDQDLKKTKDFSRVSDRLRVLKTDLMNDEIKLLEEQNDEMEKILDAIESAVGKEAVAAARKNFIMQRSMSGMGGMPGMGGGSGLQMPPATPPAAGMAGGQGLVVKNQDDLKSLGLKLKTGDVQAEGAKISPKLIELAKAVQAGVPGFNQFTGFNDKFHNEKAPSSKHTQGLAMDFTVARPPSPEDGKKVTDWLKSMGANLAIDEYNNPSSNATAGHFHAQIPAFKDGGLVDDATLSLIGEAGPEAVIPLKDGNVPVSFNGKMGLGDEAMGLFKIMAEQTATMAAMMEQMVAAQKNSVDVQTKMLRAQN